MFLKVSKVFAEHDTLNQSFDEEQAKKQRALQYKKQLNDFIICDKNKRNILHRAALQQNPRLIKEIIIGYSQIDLRNIGNYINLKDKFGLSAVLMCCFADFNTRAQCLSLFEEDADFDNYNPRTLWSAAHWVAFYGDVESLKILFAHNVIFFKPDYQGYYPLDLAGMNNREKCCKNLIEHILSQLLEYEEAKINYRKQNTLFDTLYVSYDKYLKNPLLKVSLFYWSCYFHLNLNQFTQFKRMYYHGPYLGSTSFHIAIKLKNISAFYFILNQKIDIKSLEKQLLNEQSTVFNNRIYQFTQQELLIYDQKYQKQITNFDQWEYHYLNEEISLLDQKDKYGNTPLHLASLVNSQEIVANLLSHSCAINLENNEFWRAEDLTTDKEIHVLISENESFKRKLVKSINLFLRNNDIKAKYDYATKKYHQLKDLVAQQQINDLDTNLIQLHDISEQLITPDYILKFSSLEENAKKVNFQIQVLLNYKFYVYVAQSQVDNDYFIMLKSPLQELQLQAMIQKLEVKLIDTLDYEPFDYILKEHYEPFRSLQRQAIIEDYLTKIINLRDLKEQNLIVDSFRMHSYGGTSKIKAQWLDNQRWFWPQPLNQIQDYFDEGDKQDFKSCSILRLYFGEKTAFFFAWKSYLTCFMLLVAFPGLALQIYLISAQNFNSLWNLLWVIYVSFWSTICVEFWKRKSCEINARWGMLDLMNSDEKKQRFEFQGDEEVNLVTHEITKFEKKIYTLVMFSVSLPILLFFSSFIIGIFIAIDYIQKENGITSVYSQVVVGICQGVTIAVLNVLYSLLVTWFVEKENHKYEQGYESSLIYKNVLFKSVNSYISVFYTAYIKRNSPYEELFYILLPVLVIKQFSYLIVALVFPQLMYKYKEDQYFKKIKRQAAIQQIYQDGIEIFWKKVVQQPLQTLQRCVLNVNNGQSDYNFDLDSVELNGLKFQTHKHMITNYFMESMIDFGYITLFSAAFPIGPLISLLMNILEIRMKIYSFIYVYRKPQAERIAGIGEWLYIWEMMSFLGVFTNFALVYQKQNKELNDYFFNGELTESTMMWIFILVVIIKIVLKYLIKELIPDKPEWVKQWEEEIHQRKQNQSQLNLKEQECQQLTLRLQKLEKQNNKLINKLESIQHQETQLLSLSPEKQIDYKVKSVCEQIQTSYYKNERDLLIQRFQNLNQLIKVKKIILLLCAECQQQEVEIICTFCQIQLCQRCNKLNHAEEDHSQYYMAIPIKEQMWRKFQYFGFPLSISSSFYKSFRNAYDLLSLQYEAQCYSNNLFLELKELNTEEKWYLNKIMCLLYKKEKNNWSEFQKQIKILQCGTLEQKLILMIDLLDEDNTEIISKQQFENYINVSQIQSVSIKQFPIKLFNQETYEKKELVFHTLTSLQDQPQLKRFFQVLLQDLKEN